MVENPANVDASRRTDAKFPSPPPHLSGADNKQARCYAKRATHNAIASAFLFMFVYIVWYMVALYHTNTVCAEYIYDLKNDPSKLKLYAERHGW